MIAPSQTMTAIGLMSGTLMDGIDVALIETDGETVSRFGPVASRSYAPEERAAIRRALEAARSVTDRADRSGALGDAERVVTEAHGRVVEAFLADNGLSPSDIDVVGFHGQTVVHRPDLGFTVQVGDGPALAGRLGIDVVHDLRAADMAGGGQGAPVVPVYHRALALGAGLDLPVVVANIGGVGNVTWLGDGDPVAFDTGPGNALIDDFVSGRTGAPYDDGGRLAAAGRVDQAALDRLMDNPYFAMQPPKSLDRDAFDGSPVAGLSLEDGAATLTAFTAETLAAARAFFPESPKRWIVSGGGGRNPSMLAALQARVEAPVTTANAIGWAGDHVEAQAFAFLAVRSLKGLPLTFSTTTGVREAMTGGVLARG